jgi:hypothetical protein
VTYLDCLAAIPCPHCSRPFSDASPGCPAPATHARERTEKEAKRVLRAVLGISKKVSVDAALAQRQLIASIENGDNYGP